VLPPWPVRVRPRPLFLDQDGARLDLDATEALEAALRAWDGALLLVSHDPVFVESAGVERTIELSSGA
jgi:ATPase subunit of ABC transporter with duplicated ATPase domains